MKIICDSREQEPFRFPGMDCTVASGTLDTADYSLSGFQDRIGIERKSLSDLLGCFTSGRERFVRELERMRGFESCAIVVESDWRKLVSGDYRSHMNPNAARQSVVSIMQNYRMPFFFAESRAEAERFTFDFLRHFHAHALNRYKCLAK